MKRHITLVLLLAAVLCLSGCAGLPQNPAPHAVQPDAAERYALAAFAGCPENGLRVIWIRYIQKSFRLFRLFLHC